MSDDTAPQHPVLPNAPGRCKVRSSHFHVMDDGRQVFCEGASDKAEPQRQEAIPSSLAAEASKPEHPAPWTWVDQDGDTVRLVDATGATVLEACSDDSFWLRFASPLGRELIRLAPEMEPFVRKLEWSGPPREVYMRGSTCPTCGAVAMPENRPPGRHAPDCALAAIIAALDAARKGT